MAADSIASQNTGRCAAAPARSAPDADPRPETLPGEPVAIEELTPSTPASRLDAARALLLEYGQFVVAQPGAARFCFGTLRQEADGLPMSFIRQGGGSLLATVRGHPAGFVAWRSLPAPSVAPDSIIPRSWELKRLWVRPSVRGLALGRRLTQAVLDRARAAGRQHGIPGDRSSSPGCKAVYLDTAPQSMAAAHRLYLDMGFVPCPPYNNNPVEGLVWMVKFL